MGSDPTWLVCFAFLKPGAGGKKQKPKALAWYPLRTAHNLPLSPFEMCMCVHVEARYLHQPSKPTLNKAKNPHQLYLNQPSKPS